MQVIGLCRFSYPALGGFQVKHETHAERAAYLYAQTRMAERFALFETVALPCLRAQSDPNFSLIIVIGEDFPKAYESRLEALIADLPQAIIHKEPPRKQREVMKEILNAARIDPSEPCLQFRYDDDDAVSVDFIKNLRAAALVGMPLLELSKTVAFDWNRGYLAEFGPHGITAMEVYRPYYVAALGMLIRGNCAVTVMNFGHEKIPQYMPTITYSDGGMFVRSHNEFNDSRQNETTQPPLKPLDTDQIQLFADRFAIDEAHVRRVFSGG